MNTDNYCEFYLPVKLTLPELQDALEREDWAQALTLAESCISNSRLLYVWIKDKVQHEHKVELQRVQDLRPVPKAVP